MTNYLALYWMLDIRYDIFMLDSRKAILSERTFFILDIKFDN